MYFIFICLAIAEVYSMEGDNECSKGEYHQAIGSYTEGIKVNCKDENLNAKLFTNRATVHYHLGENNELFFCLDVFIWSHSEESVKSMPFTGNYSESLRDAKVARQFQPTYMEAIIRGNVHIVLQNNKNNKNIPVNIVLKSSHSLKKKKIGFDHCLDWFKIGPIRNLR